MRTVNPELQSRRRAEIISAAEGCFLKRGFHQTSMQNIAAASGLSMGLLYRYFANKEAIIDAVAQRDQEASLAAIAALPVQGEVVTPWVTLLIEGADMASSPDYAAVSSEILAEANRSPKIREKLQASEAALELAIINKLAAQQKSGAVDLSDSVKSTAQSLMLLFDGLTMRKLVTPPEQHMSIQKGFDRMVRGLLSHGDD